MDKSDNICPNCSRLLDKDNLCWYCLTNGSKKTLITILTFLLLSINVFSQNKALDSIPQFTTDSTINNFIIHVNYKILIF